MWSQINQGSISILWCDGYRAHTRRDQKTSADTSESDHPDSEKSREKPKRKKPRKASAVDDKRERVEGIKAELREKQGSSYTPIQYTLWAEMIDVGTHKSTEEPPSAPMFMGRAAEAKKTSDNDMGVVFTEVAKSVISALKSPTPVSPASTSQVRPLVAYLQGKQLTYAVSICSK